MEWGRTSLWGGVLLVLAGCGGATVDVGAAPREADGSGPSTASAQPTTDVLPGVPDECSLAELVEWDPSSADTQQGRAVKAGLDDGVERGPLVVVASGDGHGSGVVAATLVDDRGALADVALWRVDGRSGAVMAANAPAGGISSFDVDLLHASGTGPMARAAALAMDCSMAAAGRLHPGPPPAEPTMRPDLLVPEPATVRPGEIVEMRFPEETLRGVAFQLDRRTNGNWETSYWLTSDGNGGEPEWVPAGTEGYGWPDVGVGGPGPDRILIPEDAEPGSYRVCTANAGDDFCAPLEIVE